MRDKINRLFQPQSVVVIGASEREGKIGNIIAKNLLQLGFEGDIFFVNPKYDNIFGRKCYKDINNIRSDIDLAIIAIPAEFVNKAIYEAREKVKNFVVISAGFSEIGNDGVMREKKMLEIANEYRLNILGPNCLGFISPEIKLNASFSSGMPESGGISLISQSGALAVAMIDMAKKEGFKFSKIISVGNKMQLDESVLLKYLQNDKQTEVIAIYAEGITDGEKFLNVASQVSPKKPIIILKSGKSEKAKKAIASHTGALAGSDSIMDVAFKKAGILRADNLENFFELVKFVSIFGNIKNFKTSIITNAGGPGVLAVDSFENANLELVNFSNTTKSKLKKFLPKESSVENPIDLLGDADENRYANVLNVLTNENVGIIISLLTAQDQTPVNKISRVLLDRSRKSSQVIIPVFIGDKKIEEGVRILNNAGLTSFEYPENIVYILDKLARRKKYLVNDFKDNKVIINAKRKKNNKKIIEEALKNKRKALSFSDACKILRSYNISTIKYKKLTRSNKLSFVVYAGEFPVVLKVDSDDILHKTDKNALRLGIKNKKELRKELRKMRKEFPNSDLIIQKMLKNEVELILGMKEDVSFGKAIVFGLGGIYTEIFKMVDFMLLPLSKDEIKKILLNGKVNFLFKKTRGKVILDIEKITELIFNFSKMIIELNKIKEIDINPLMVVNGDVVAVDIKLIVQ